MAFRDVNRSTIIRPIYGAAQSAPAASTTQVLRLPQGATYADLILFMTIAGTAATRAQIEAQLANVRVSLSGEEKINLTGKEVIAICEFYESGVVADTGMFLLPFSRLWMNGASAQLEPDWGTNSESSFQIELTWAAGTTIDLVQTFARIETTSQELGAHVRPIKLTPTFASTGKYIYPDLPNEPGTFLYALHYEVPVVANLTNVALLVDDVRLLDCPPAVTDAMQRRGYRARTPQTAKLFVHTDFTSRGFDSDAIPLGLTRRMELELTFANAAPNSFSIIAEIGTVKPTQAGAARQA